MRPSQLLTSVLAHIFLVQDWFPSLAFSLDAATWTLSCEAFFYLLFPFAVAWLGGKRRQRFPLLVALVLFQLLPPILNSVWLMPHHAAWGRVGSNLLAMPIGRVGEFLFGVVLGLAFRDRQVRSRGALPASPAWLLPCSLAVCLAALSCNGLIPHEIFRNGVMVIPYALLIWSLAGSRSRLLASAPLQIGGEISYGVYLLQMPLAGTLLFLRSRLAPNLVPHGRYMLLIYPFAWLTYSFLEKPARALILGRPNTEAGKPIPTPQLQLP